MLNLITNEQKKILIIMGHGLGDNVQLQIVLRHIKHYCPNWTIHVMSEYKFCFVGHCDKVLQQPPDTDNYDAVYNLSWGWSWSYPDAEIPSTKATNSIKVDFRLKPIKDFYYYQLHVDDENKKIVDEFLSRLPNDKYVGIHYQGGSISEVSFFGDRQVRNWCDAFLEHGFTPIIFEGGQRGFHKSKLVNDREIFKSQVPASSLVYLIECCDFFMGVDSGPLHIAGATSTPSLGIWEYTHPVDMIDICQNMVHYVPHRDGGKRDIVLKTVYKTVPKIADAVTQVLGIELKEKKINSPKFI